MNPDVVWNLLYFSIAQVIKWIFSKDSFSALLVLAGSIITLVLTNKHNKNENEKNRQFQFKQTELQTKENFISRSLESRISAYSSLFGELRKLDSYFNSFIEQRNELITPQDASEFAPLQHMEGFRDIYLQQEIWFSEELRKSAKEILSHGSNGVDISTKIAEANLIIKMKSV